jgi:hypothetical protein
MAGSRYLFSDEIIERARREFGDDADRVIEELDRMPDTRDRDRDRLPRAVLDLALRDVSAVSGLVEQALIDWRDLLTWVDDA